MRTFIVFLLGAFLSTQTAYEEFNSAQTAVPTDGSITSNCGSRSSACLISLAIRAVLPLSD
jgi:hypothetical protein